MGLKAWNGAVLMGIGAIWLCGTTQREKPVTTDAHSTRVASSEEAAAQSPNDPVKVRELAQAYLDSRQPGMAVATIERAPAPVRKDPNVEHLYACALLDQGRAADALAAEKRVLDRCADPIIATPCSTYLIASATRRAEILDQLVQLGVEDANAHPEASSLAYHNATRQVGISVSR